MAPTRPLKPTGSPKMSASRRWIRGRPPVAPKFRAARAPTVELKFKDTTLAATAVTAAGNITNSTLVGIQEGNTDQTRVGNKITVKTVMLRGTVVLPTAATAASGADVVRVILYLDRGCNGSAATVAELLASADYRAFNNLDNNDRFRTLAETTMSLNNLTNVPTAGGTMSGVYANFFLKGKVNLPFKYKGNTGAVADMANNNIGVMVIGRDEHATIEYIARVKYTDQ